MSGLDVEGVLAEHGFVVSGVCACGEAVELEHRAHVAAVLREQIEAAQAMAWAEGASEGIRTPPNLAYALANPYRAAQVAPSRVPGEES